MYAVFIVLLLCLSPVMFADRSYAGDVDANTDIGANVNVNDGLRAAILSGDLEKAKSFIENGADVNKSYDDGSTPLLDVIEKSNGSPDMVDLLLKQGANPKARPNGFTALSSALKANNEALIQLLRPYAEGEDEFYGLAAYLWDKKEDAPALEYADKTLSLDPSNCHVLALKGSIYVSQKKLKAAEAAYAKALEISLENLKTDKSEDGYLSVVRFALLSENFTQAQRLGNDGLSYFPGNSVLAMNVGHALLFLDNRKEALALYKKSYKSIKRQNGDQASQMFTNDFSQLKERYPDKIALIGWAEKRLLEPFDFPYDEMPFGEEKEAVLGSVEGADVNKDETAIIGTVDPIVRKQLGEGLYADELKTRVSPTVVEKYSVACDKWDTIERIDLFFTAFPGQEWNRTLFLVSKYFKEQSGKLDALFSAMQADVSRELKVQPAVQNTEITSQSGPLPVKLAVWKSNDATVVLEVFNVSSSSVRSRMLYVSKKGWEKYLHSLRVSKPQ